MEIITRDDARRDAEVTGLLRSAQHADKRKFDDLIKKLTKLAGTD